MRQVPIIPAACLIAALAATPVLAQNAPQSASPQSTSPATAAPAPGGDAHLTVATVRMNGGVRASKVIGATVANDRNESIGTVDDLMIAEGDRIAVAVISVGGFLGIGSKLVAVPYDQLRPAKDGRLTWPGASKQSLNDMPSFTYGG